MPNIRMLAPSNLGRSNYTNNGRTYTPVAGQVFDIPDFDADWLEASGWVRIFAVGPTSARPVYNQVIYAGNKFLDTTIGAIIVFDGLVWRNALNGSVV